VRLSRGVLPLVVFGLALTACSGSEIGNSAPCVVPSPHASSRHVLIGGTVVLSASGIGCHPDFSGPHTVTIKGVPNDHPNRAMSLVVRVSKQGSFRAKVHVPPDWDPGHVVFELYGPLVDRSCPPNASCKALEVALFTDRSAIQTAILAVALRAAAHAGDARPTLIQHSMGSRYKANLAASGEITGGQQHSFLIAERGHFVLTNVGIGNQTIRGSVITLVYNAKTRDVTDYGLQNNYPNLAALGPVTTDLRTAG
jgi:hypothetical protein